MFRLALIAFIAALAAIPLLAQGPAWSYDMRPSSCIAKANATDLLSQEPAIAAFEQSDHGTVLSLSFPMRADHWSPYKRAAVQAGWIAKIGRTGSQLSGKYSVEWLGGKQYLQAKLDMSPAHMTELSNALLVMLTAPDAGQPLTGIRLPKFDEALADLDYCDFVRTRPNDEPYPVQPLSDALREMKVSDNSLLSGSERAVAARLQINALGSVTECSIARSSGNNAVDREFCRVLKLHARFIPARDGDAKPVSSDYFYETSLKF